MGRGLAVLVVVAAMLVACGGETDRPVSLITSPSVERAQNYVPPVIESPTYLLTLTAYLFAVKQSAVHLSWTPYTYRTDQIAVYIMEGNPHPTVRVEFARDVGSYDVWNVKKGTTYQVCATDTSHTIVPARCSNPVTP